MCPSTLYRLPYLRSIFVPYLYKKSQKISRGKAPEEKKLSEFSSHESSDRSRVIMAESELSDQNRVIIELGSLSTGSLLPRGTAFAPIRTRKQRSLFLNPSPELRWTHLCSARRAFFPSPTQCLLGIQAPLHPPSIGRHPAASVPLHPF